MDKHLADFATHLAAIKKIATPTDVSINSEILFGSLINNELQYRMEASELAKANSLIASYQKAVQFCRTNNLPVAQAQLIACDELLYQLPAASAPFVRLIRAGAWSNYFYKAQRSDSAIEVVCEGLQLSATIERQGYPMLLYWRIGQLFNVTSVLFKAQALTQAHQLLKNALIFTHTGRAIDLLIADWNGVAIDNVRVLQEGSLDQLFRQVARQNMLLMTHEHYNNEYYYHFFFQELMAEMETETYNRTVIYNWMYCKASYEEQGLAAFLANTLDFLTDAVITREFNLYKANLMAQVQLLIQRQFPHCTQAAEQVRSFSEANFSGFSVL